MNKLIFPIAYLEDHDFDTQGNLICEKISKNVPVVIMVQSSWCRNCSDAKSDFQLFANATQGKVFCATIQADGERKSEKKLGQRITALKSNFIGFPDYLLYKNGVRINKEIQGRNVINLRNFARLI